MHRGLFKPVAVCALAIAVVAGVVSFFVETSFGVDRHAQARNDVSERSASEMTSDHRIADGRVATKIDRARPLRPASGAAEEIEIPAGLYSDAIPALRTAAHSGDARGAYVLSRMLIDCFLVSRGRPSGFGSSNADRCNQIAVNDTREAVQMLRQAADAGLVQAQVLYPDAVAELMTPTDMMRDPDAVKQYKERSMAYLASAADQGSGQALLQIASAYANGVMTERDLPMAYAYRYAVNQAFPELGGDDPVLLYGGGLTDDQLSVAKRLGDTIYHRCCR